MKLVFALLALAVAVSARPAELGDGVIRYDKTVGPEGYDFAYELTDGTKRQEKGIAIGEKYDVNGDYQFISPEGRTISVVFTAGEQGFAPRVTYA